MSKSFKKTLGVIAAILLVAFIVLGSMQLWAPSQYKPLNWVKGKGEETAEVDYSGLILTLASESDIMTLSADDNGEAVDSVTVTASVNEVTAQHLGIIFSLDWESYNTAEVSDYLTMTVQGKTATVTCLQAFGVPIILTATLDGTDKSASYRFDYLAPIVNLNNVFATSEKCEYMSTMCDSAVVDYDTETLNNAALLNSGNVVYGVGTVYGKFELSSIMLALNYMSSDGKEHNISGTSNFYGLRQTLHYGYNAVVSVRDYIKITEFEEAENGHYSFNFNVSDFFEFTNFDYETQADEYVQEKCAAALLEACGSGKSICPIYSTVYYSYTHDGRTWEYQRPITLVVNFGNLISGDAEVSLNDGESGYTFGG